MRRKDLLVSVCLLTVGGVLIVLGVCRGEHITVLEKTIKICLECIGIG